MTSAERITDLLVKYPAGAQAKQSFQRKRDGTRRPITEPNEELRKWLRSMNKALSKQFNDWPQFMHGGIKKRSYISYARPHVNRQCLITIDIKRCFDSITVTDVSKVLAEQLGLPENTCKELAERLCFRGKVAQGFATSNYLSNLYLLQPLTSINERLTRQGLRFGNYVDDLAVSGAIHSKDEVINSIVLELSRAGLAVNKAKILVMPAHKQQIICGLLVNKRLSLTKTLKLRLFSSAANRTMNEASAEGWVSNLKSVDPVFREKFRAYAIRKGLLRNYTKS